MGPSKTRLGRLWLVVIFHYNQRALRHFYKYDYIVALYNPSWRARIFYKSLSNVCKCSRKLLGHPLYHSLLKILLLRLYVKFWVISKFPFDCIR